MRLREASGGVGRGAPGGGEGSRRRWGGSGRGLRSAAGASRGALGDKVAPNGRGSSRRLARGGSGRLRDAPGGRGGSGLRAVGWLVGLRAVGLLEAVGSERRRLREVRGSERRGSVRRGVAGGGGSGRWGRRRREAPGGEGCGWRGGLQVVAGRFWWRGLRSVVGGSGYIPQHSPSPPQLALSPHMVFAQLAGLQAAERAAGKRCSGR
ncbi:hypothetical protein GUJ93_ZPchr0008g11623 [Zizania palustris]|uniref:Uncharacterized protein n=1 Tax=Zizania palustris TaxID=103762 RepID=A0A8J5VKD6_ZIZPA|nr:hypothetical protein GUJ93_ZPchr0008g11623 [Zizania palustris]